MKLELITDGTDEGSRFVDLETGETVTDVLSVSWCGKRPRLTNIAHVDVDLIIRFCSVPKEAQGTDIAHFVREFCRPRQDHGLL